MPTSRSLRWPIRPRHGRRDAVRCPPPHAPVLVMPTAHGHSGLRVGNSETHCLFGIRRVMHALARAVQAPRPAIRLALFPSSVRL